MNPDPATRDAKRRDKGKYQSMTPAEQIALWADKLRDISAMGLHFSKNVHDEEAFRAVQTIAMEMLALATGESLEHMESLRASVFSRPTPISAGDAAVIDDRGQILLVQRADNGKWAMPGGALEVGETPAEGVVREKPTHALEVLDVDWFPKGELPEALDPGHVTRIPEAYRVWHGDRRAFFDGSRFA